MAQIKTYARLKPTPTAYAGYAINDNVLTVDIPGSKDFMVQGNQQVPRSNISYDIKFTGIFHPEASQSEVFDVTAVSIIQNFLNGYNGTIFAYGQTGTGKTYTVEGNSCQYEKRGLATRALSMIYQQLQNRSDEQISVYLSYLEIYQEVAYDLLNPATRTSMPLAPFSKVNVVEGPHGSCILRGLSLHLAANEEVAQMLLLQGQANRKVAETPVNQRSSRSHAVFTVYLQAKKKDSEIILTSKLHLVDLAGSERVSKTGVDGQQLTEAKSINLSLHHLETVIIALQSERGGSAGAGARGEILPSKCRSNTSHMSTATSENMSRGSRFIPYRNSLLTMVLKDSLGGNCLTAMIATISMELENVGESISTCRFAQRVARISNNARRNEKVDDKTLIKRLKGKVAELERQVALLRSKGSSEEIIGSSLIDSLSEEDRLACAEIFEGYLTGVVLDPVSAGISNQHRFRQFLELLRDRYFPLYDDKPSSSDEQQVKSNTAPSRQHHDSGDNAGSLGATSYNMLSFSSPLGTVSSTASSSPIVNLSQMETKQSDVFMNPSREENKNLKKSTVDDQGKSDTPEMRAKALNQLLLSLHQRDKYKSPFERKREKEIKKLSQKVSSMEEEQAVKQEQLQLMRENSLMDELETSENSMKLKLQVAEEQVADQHGYVSQLKHIQADPELIAREKLVETQLIKRQLRFKEKLDEIIKAKQELRQKLNGPQVETQKEKPSMSLEQKFGCYKQGKTLNTRQVFDMLKTEEKKQKKESEKLDREKVVMKTKQLAMKEEATLEKLRELKQMLKLSQQKSGLRGQEVIDVEAFPSAETMCTEEDIFDSGSSSDKTCLGQSAGNKSGMGISTAWLEAKTSNSNNTQVNGENSQSRSKVHDSNLHSCNDTDDKISRMESYLEQVLSGNFINKAYAGSQKGSTNNSQSALGGIFNKAYPKSGPWEDSDNDTEADLEPAQQLSDSSVSQSLSGNNTNPLNSHPVYQGTGNRGRLFGENTNIRLNVSQSLSGVKGYLNQAQNSNNSNSNPTDTIIPNSNKKSGKAEDLKNQTTIIEDLEDDSEQSATKTSTLANGHGTSMQFDSSQSGAVSQTGKLLQNGDSGSVTNPSNEPVPEDRFTSQKMMFVPTPPPPAAGPVLTPSEYVYSMSNDDKFDARRMGLGSRTFDSALSHMLDRDTSTKATSLSPERNGFTPHFSEEMYDQYARQNNFHSSSRHRRQDKSPARRHPSPSKTATSPPPLSNSSSYTSGYESYNSRRRAERSRSGTSEEKADLKTTWGPDIKNASVADRLANLLDTSADDIPVKEKSSHSFYPKHKPPSGLDTFDSKLAQFRSGERDAGLFEEDSFFSSQPESIPIKALTEEEGERTYMSRVALEKERVAKIRKAREAAEVIQRRWRKFRSGL